LRKPSHYNNNYYFCYGKNPDIKIIAISGGGSRDKLEYLETIKEFGVQRTFAKPFAAKDFLAGIRDLLLS